MMEILIVPYLWEPVSQVHRGKIRRFAAAETPPYHSPSIHEGLAQFKQIP
jgi:hypothetical protein